MGKKNRLMALTGILLGLVSCTEPIVVHTADIDRTYLIVEGLLTDTPGRDQFVKLSQSINYFDDREVPRISGATVTVSDGEREVLFAENPENPGEYRAPEEFKAELDKTYRLDIDAVVDGVRHRYEAEAEMPELGFDLEKIDYTYNGNTAAKLDSLWTVLMWGKDDVKLENNFIAYISVNDKRLPLGSCLMIHDKYFQGKRIEKFPVGLLYQTAANRKQYGDCAKFLEEGDVIQLEGYALSDAYYRFLLTLHGDGGLSSMPLMSSQPANPETNVHGDADVLGFFAVCSTAYASVTVSNPFQVIQ